MQEEKGVGGRQDPGRWGRDRQGVGVGGGMGAGATWGMGAGSAGDGPGAVGRAPGEAWRVSAAAPERVPRDVRMLSTE